MLMHPQSVFFIILILSVMKIFAQETSAPTSTAPEDGDISKIETQLEKNMPNASDTIAPAVLMPAKPISVNDYKEILKPETQKSEVIVIQKNYMPKSERFQFFGGLTYMPTDVFFKTVGLQLKMGYHFSERWGAELSLLGFSSSDSDEKKDLANKQSVSVQALVTATSFVGVDAYFNSMYGKAAMYGRSIVPFEIYQTFGLGTVATSGGSSGALHVGVGEIFSLSQSDSLRLDLSLLSYQATNIQGQTQFNNNIIITFGYGRFFPEAQTR